MPSSSLEKNIAHRTRDLLSVASFIGCLSAFLLEKLREHRVSPASLIFNFTSTCTRASVDTRARTYTNTDSCVHGISSYVSFQVSSKLTGYDVTQLLRISYAQIF